MWLYSEKSGVEYFKLSGNFLKTSATIFLISVNLRIFFKLKQIPSDVS